MVTLCPFCEMVIRVPPLETETDRPPWVTVTFEPSPDTVTLCPFCETCTLLEVAPHDWVVRFTLTLDPCDEDCELCTLTTQVEHEPPELALVMLLLCCCVPPEFICETCTLTWQPLWDVVPRRVVRCASLEVAEDWPLAPLAAPCSTGAARVA